MRAVLCLLSSVLAAAAPSTATAAQNGNGADTGRSVIRQSSWIPMHRSAAASLGRSVRVDLAWAPVREALQQIADRAGLELAYSKDVQAARHRVSVRAERVTVADALARVLDGTGLEAYVTRQGDALLVRRADLPESVETPKASTGTINGRVTDSESGAGVSGASVLLDSTSFQAVTGNTGRYRIADVPAGTYEIMVQQIGFIEARQSVTVEDGQEVAVDFALEVSALPLDEIVATGTAFETRMRTVPNPISVIASEDIQAKGAANITDLLRGEIPGVFALSDGQYDYESRIYVRGDAGWTSLDLIKIYIDGVEIANPQYLSTIDPKSIERVEVVRGPQASVIYGSEAASGVLQIFTKKGDPGLDRPRLAFQASTGILESDYTPSDATPLTQDYAFAANGGTESFTYRAGASYVTVGEWVKNYGSKTLSFSGGLRAQHGPLTAELTALWSDRDHDRAHYDFRCRYPAYIDSSVSNAARCDSDYFENQDIVLSQNTMGLSLTYRATPRWTHTLILGDDQNRFASYQPEPNELMPADTFVSLDNSETRRRSVRYNTAYDMSWGNSVTGRFTLGVDYSSYDVVGSSGSDLLSAFGTVQTSENTAASFQNDGWWNAGYFGLAELGWRDEVYLTLAARIEEMRNLGENYGRPVQPRVGVSYVRDLGEADLKLRAQWGKGVRLPPARARVGSESDVLKFLPNPSVGPEEKIGWDAGVELYLGRTGSLAVTRYEEEGRNLIQAVIIEQVAFPYIYQYQNIGKVGNKGWEVEGTLNVGRFSIKANYAYADNRIRELSNQYPTGPDQQYQAGDRMLWTPAHSGGGTLVRRLWHGSVSVSASVLGPRRYFDRAAYYDYLYGGESYRGSQRAYYVLYPAIWKWHLRAEQSVGGRLTAFLSVDNVFNNQNADLSNVTVARGRATALGLRISY